MSALVRAMVPGNESLRDEGAFNRLALDLFRYQVDGNQTYGAFVRARGIEPSEVDDWRTIPPVPTRAFKELELVTLDPRPIEATFRTSGTTRGPGGRGRHLVRDLSLYRSSLLGAAIRFLRPELLDRGPVPSHEARAPKDKTRIRVLIITPPPREQPDSSLVRMFATWLEAWDDGGGGFLGHGDWQIAAEECSTKIRQARADGIRVLLAGTAFGFVGLLDRLGEGRISALPESSIVIETGGFKGRSRAVPRAELYERISESFRVPTQRIVNEYGMTELLSQFYEPVLVEDGPDDPSQRRHLGPPWIRTQILDPLTLAAVRTGETGVLCHLDLANLDSVAAVLTEDLGVAVADGFRLLGRGEEAEPRGCSLMMEELITASRSSSGT